MKTPVKTLSPQQARQRMLQLSDYLLFDLRTRAEYCEMHLPGALCVPAAGLAAAVARAAAARDTPVFLYCRVGLRSRAAAEELARLGYTQVYDLGGIVDWPYEVVGGC